MMTFLYRVINLQPPERIPRSVLYGWCSVRVHLYGYPTRGVLMALMAGSPRHDSPLHRFPTGGAHRIQYDVSRVTCSTNLLGPKWPF